MLHLHECYADVVILGWTTAWHAWPASTSTVASECHHNPGGEVAITTIAFIFRFAAHSLKSPRATKLAGTCSTTIFLTFYSSPRKREYLSNLYCWKVFAQLCTVHWSSNSYLLVSFGYLVYTQPCWRTRSLCKKIRNEMP